MKKLESIHPRLTEHLHDYIIINCAVVNDETFIIVARYSPPGVESDHDAVMEKEPARVITVHLGSKTAKYIEYERLSRTINAAGGVLNGHKQALIADHEGTITYYGYGYGGESGYEGEFTELSGTRTNVKAITTIGQHFYLVGLKGIFKRDRYGVYSHISEQVMDYYQRQGRIPQFVSVDGFSETDMYALERSCVVWHYDGEDWELEDLPFNFKYCDTIICAPDGNVYILSSHGRAAVKINGKWESVITESLFQSYGDHFCWFKGKLYLANESNPYYLDLDQKAWIQDNRLPFAKSISANENVMILTDLWHAYIYDGETLTCIYRNADELNQRGVALASAQIFHTLLENHPEIMELLEKAVELKKGKGK